MLLLSLHSISSICLHLNSSYRAAKDHRKQYAPSWHQVLLPRQLGQTVDEKRRSDNDCSDQRQEQSIGQWGVQVGWFHFQVFVSAAQPDSLWMRKPSSRDTLRAWRHRLHVSQDAATTCLKGLTFSLFSPPESCLYLYLWIKNRLLKQIYRGSAPSR